MQNVYYTVHLALRIVHCAFFIMRFAFLSQAFFGFGYEKLSEYYLFKVIEIQNRIISNLENNYMYMIIDVRALQCSYFLVNNLLKLA